MAQDCSHWLLRQTPLALLLHRPVADVLLELWTGEVADTAQVRRRLPQALDSRPDHLRGEALKHQALGIAQEYRREVGRRDPGMKMHGQVNVVRKERNLPQREPLRSLKFL